MGRCLPPDAWRWWVLYGVAAVAVGLALVIGRWTPGVVPPLPDLTDQPDSLRQALTQAHRRAETGRDAVALGELARLYHANLFYPQAEQCYLLALARAPDDPRLCYLLAVLRQTLGRSDDVEELLQRTLQLQADCSPAALKLADLQLKNGNPDAARRTYQRCLEIVPDHPFALLGLARIALDSGDTATARAHLEAAIRKYPHFGAGYRLLGNILREQNETEAAEIMEIKAARAGRFLPPFDQWVDELAFLCFRPDHLIVLADMARYGHDTPRVLALLRRAVEVAPQDSTAWFQLGRALQENGEVDQAERHLRRAIDLNPRNAEARYHLAMILGDRNDTLEAEAQVREVLAINPWSENGYFGLGMVARARGEYSLAARHFLCAATLSEFGYDNAVEQYVYALRRSSGEAAAIAFLSDLVARRPAAVAPRCSLASLHAQQGDWSRAQEVLREGLARRFDATLADRLARVLATRSGATSEEGQTAVALARRANQVCEPEEQPGCLDTLAVALARAGAFGEARAVALQAHKAAVAAGKTELADRIRLHLDQISRQRPIDEPP